MNYLKQSVGSTAKKLIRYIGMYGFQRAVAKLRARKHLLRTYKTLPPMKGDAAKNQTVGIVGCGDFSFTAIAFYLRKEFGSVFAVCMDKDIHRAASFAAHYKAPLYTDNINVVTENKNVRLVYVASDNASHAEYAVKALEAGKNVYIENPHVTTMDELRNLHRAMQKHSGRVYLGFSRPVSPFGKIIIDILHAASGPATVNWFVVGHSFDQDQSYPPATELSGALGDLCHWTDFSLRLVKENVFPITIVPARMVNGAGNLAVALIFGDGTIANITYSGQGYRLEDVRESLRAQKGNILIAMDDFKSLEIELLGIRRRTISFYHDHGHKNNIVNAYRNSTLNLPYDRQREFSHILNTAWVFLNTAEAFERNERITIDSYEKSRKPVKEPKEKAARKQFNDKIKTI